MRRSHICTFTSTVSVHEVSGRQLGVTLVASVLHKYAQKRSLAAAFNRTVQAPDGDWLPAVFSALYQSGGPWQGIGALTTSVPWQRPPVRPN
jgi:hypothetical protein